mmetsp:Transcript_14336/g.22571  ORF Transcript_14336/g.22571 Transcript_14336/m.22571 type:complete len:98 (-) Transcript_14336:291-584(-)
MTAVAPINATLQQPAATSSSSTSKTKNKNRCLKFLRNCAKDFTNGMAVDDYSDVGLGPSRANMAAQKKKRLNGRTEKQVAKNARRSEGFSSYADCGL